MQSLRQPDPEQFFSALGGAGEPDEDKPLYGMALSGALTLQRSHASDVEECK